MVDSATPADASAPPALDRALAILWRDHAELDAAAAGRRGPRQRLTVDQVIVAAIALADTDGLSAVTVRKVADLLGIGAMTLYTYVPGRDELVGFMVDRVMADFPKPAFTGTLRSRLTALADAQVSAVKAHPWILDIDESRPLIGPGGSDLWEWQLSAVEAQGMDDFEMQHTVSLVTGFASMAARWMVNLTKVRDASDKTDAEWWTENAPLLAELMPADRYPISGRVGTSIGEAYQSATHPESSYRFGLDRILDGIELYLASKG